MHGGIIAVYFDFGTSQRMNEQHIELVGRGAPLLVSFDFHVS